MEPGATWVCECGMALFWCDDDVCPFCATPAPPPIWRLCECGKFTLRDDARCPHCMDDQIPPLDLGFEVFTPGEDE